MHFRITYKNSITTAQVIWTVILHSSAKLLDFWCLFKSELLLCRGI